MGLRNEIANYSSYLPVAMLYRSEWRTWHKNNNVVIGKIFNNIGKKFSWKADAEIYLTGYRSGDFILDGEMAKTFSWKKGDASWAITGGIANRQPSFWYEQWGGNNFRWTNNLRKELRASAGSSFIYPARKLAVKIKYAVIDNYTDFDTLALPAQHKGGLSVASLYIKKEFRAWKFHLANEGLVQKSSNNEVLDLPLVSLKSAAFFEHLFRFRSTGGKLYFQIGADLVYHTLYKPYSYMPATGRFYRQTGYEGGSYPFVDFFLNFKIQRTRAFIMFDHVNSGLSGTNYFMTAYYPMNIRMLRYGLAWTFYN